MPMSDAIAEAKLRVENAKSLVRSLQLEMPQLKADALQNSRGGWVLYNRKKKEFTGALAELGAAKADLTKLSGTGGGDPRWNLLRKAWLLLNRMQESGVDIGDEGQELIDDIEFHVPAAKLQAAIEEDTNSKEG